MYSFTSIILRGLFTPSCSNRYPLMISYRYVISILSHPAVYLYRFPFTKSDVFMDSIFQYIISDLRFPMRLFGYAEPYLPKAGPPDFP